MTSIHPSRLLLLGLRMDVAGSLSVAVLQLAGTEWLSRALQLPAALLTETGWFMLAYAVALAGLSTRKTMWRVLVGVIGWGNLGWTAVSLLLLLSTWVAPNALGQGYIVAQALAVAGFAVLQIKGLAASAPAAQASALQRPKSAT